MKHKTFDDFSEICGDLVESLTGDRESLELLQEIVHLYLELHTDWKAGQI